MRVGYRWADLCLTIADRQSGHFGLGIKPLLLLVTIEGHWINICGYHGFFCLCFTGPRKVVFRVETTKCCQGENRSLAIIDFIFSCLSNKYA